MGSAGNTMPRCSYRPLVLRMLLPVAVAMVTAGKGAHLLVRSCATEGLCRQQSCHSTLEVGALSRLRGPFRPLSLSCISKQHLFFFPERLTGVNIRPSMAESSLSLSSGLSLSFPYS